MQVIIFKCTFSICIIFTPYVILAMDLKLPFIMYDHHFLFSPHREQEQLASSELDDSIGFAHDVFAMGSSRIRRRHQHDRQSGTSGLPQRYQSRSSLYRHPHLRTGIDGRSRLRERSRSSVHDHRLNQRNIARLSIFVLWLLNA